MGSPYVYMRGRNFGGFFNLAVGRPTAKLSNLNHRQFFRLYGIYVEQNSIMDGLTLDWRIAISIMDFFICNHHYTTFVRLWMRACLNKEGRSLLSALAVGDDSDTEFC